ncbi:MAG TPA: hypothetical protein VFF68_08395 [Anaerolineaceae bacterium]|nr:hypothetical protein [Anaerolineaceae bacterium]
MRFLAFFRIQFHLLIVRWRWLLPLPVMAFIGYLLINALKVHLLPEFLSPPGQEPQVNAWDALFIAFGNAYYMVFVIANLFLILVCDSLPESGFGQLALFRLGSRKTWWAAKSLAMLLAALLYTLMCMLIVLGVASIGLPFRLEWSPWTAGYPANALLPFFVPEQMSPLAAATVLFGLDVLGFWTLGTLVQVITLFTHRYLYGYFAALLVLLGSFALSGSLINIANALHLLPPVRNMILTFYPYPFREVPLAWSYVYWGVVLGLLLLTGAFTSRRQNYLTNRP